LTSSTSARKPRTYRTSRNSSGGRVSRTRLLHRCVPARIEPTGGVSSWSIPVLYVASDGRDRLTTVTVPTRRKQAVVESTFVHTSKLLRAGWDFQRVGENKPNHGTSHRDSGIFPSDKRKPRRKEIALWKKAIAKRNGDRPFKGDPSRTKVIARE